MTFVLFCMIKNDVVVHPGQLTGNVRDLIDLLTSLFKSRFQWIDMITFFKPEGMTLPAL